MVYFSCNVTKNEPVCDFLKIDWVFPILANFAKYCTMNRKTDPHDKSYSICQD